MNTAEGKPPIDWSTYVLEIEEEEIPLPTKRVSGGNVPDPRFPFERLEIGKHFFIPGEMVGREGEDKKLWQKRVHGRCAMTGKRLKMRFLSRIATGRHPVTGEECEGIRVWRVEPLPPPQQPKKSRQNDSTGNADQTGSVRGNGARPRNLEEAAAAGRR